jgi:hypothetical protein
MDIIFNAENETHENGPHIRGVFLAYTLIVLRIQTQAEPLGSYVHMDSKTSHLLLG